jgi:glycosyltransferase involved in cell wall biosynthesis
MQKNKMKDVLFLCQFFYPEYISSATLPFDTAEQLVQCGYTVGALCGYPKEYNQVKGVPIREKIHNINIRRLKYVQLKRSNFIGRLINYFSFMFAVLFHIGEIKNYRIVIVYSNPPVLPLIAVIAKKIFNVRIVFVSYDVYPEIAVASHTIAKNDIIYRLFKYVNNRIYNNVDKVVSVSSDMEKYLIDNRNIKSNQIITIPNWYEDIALDNKLLKSYQTILNIPEDTFVVSYLGNLGTCQEMDTLLNTIRFLKHNTNIHFVFAGHGNKMETLKTAVKNEKLNNVTVFGFLHGEEFNYILLRSNAFVVSLVEGLVGLCAPSKTYSYMMAGKPIFAVMEENTELAETLIDNKAGYHIKYGDFEYMGDRIISLLNDKNLWTEMGKNARKLFLEKYSRNKCTLQYAELIKKELES